jgi:hypothetical protein
MLILLLAVVCCLAGAVPAAASTAPVPVPLLQSWSDRGLIAADDDWSRVAAVVGYRGDGLTSEPGVDPRTVVADGSGTPVDVSANRTDPRAVGLAAGVAEFEIANPVVAIQGSATASAPQLVLALDTRGRRDISVRLLLRDVDASAADATEPVAVQYRVGASGAFANVPGGYVADATTGPELATLATPVRAQLPAAANDRPLVQVRVITTNSAGQDEWVGVDDIEVVAASGGGPGTCPGPPPVPGTSPAPGPPVAHPDAGEKPEPPALELAGLTLAPEAFTPARRGGALVRRGGAALRFRLSRPAQVRFTVVRAGAAPEDLAPKEDALDRRLAAGSQAGGRATGGSAARRDPTRGRAPRYATGGRFSLRARRGLNRLRFSGLLRGRPLAPGAYVLRGVAIDRAGRESAPATVRFRIGGAMD